MDFRGTVIYCKNGSEILNTQIILLKNGVRWFNDWNVNNEPMILKFEALDSIYIFIDHDLKMSWSVNGSSTNSLIDITQAIRKEKLRELK